MIKLLKNVNYLDVRTAQYQTGKTIVIKDRKIEQIGDNSLLENPIYATKDTPIDCSGLFLLPGLIDAHVHTTAITPDFAELEISSPFYVAVQSTHILQGMLKRGFTTVRDAGGADYGLAKSTEESPELGPRILFCGKALSQTGGHGDVRTRGRLAFEGCFCCCGLGRVCDGITEVRKAARDEIRKGANQIKIMASGGVSSPTDRIDSTQYSIEELRAIVQEAEAANIYCMAHAYTARAVKRLLENGVRTIEHGNLIDQECCDLFVKYGAYLVPTLITYSALAKEGVASGLPASMEEKIYRVLDAGEIALKMAYDTGVKMLYGSDLLGAMHKYQLEEFNIRAKIVDNAELIRQATCNAADCFKMQGVIGEILVGADASFVGYNKDPLKDISVMTTPEASLKLLMNQGYLIS
ncbi:metal-dependent hydrolase family protein [Pelistega europaea]|uniref:Amidohydrolase family protein n=1 Tax=Pelistega europaea TaxID=106147 RepID=A0A7Y4LCK6_9BURK|nr:amidohydrolase family protein [Pelistega europaea]NOL50046.1 amidohydrolase family protein [Pelistega europaea]